jgi:hypothetical protein
LNFPHHSIAVILKLRGSTADSLGRAPSEGVVCEACRSSGRTAHPDQTIPLVPSVGVSAAVDQVAISIVGERRPVECHHLIRSVETVSADGLRQHDLREASSILNHAAVGIIHVAEIADLTLWTRPGQLIDPRPTS